MARIQHPAPARAAWLLWGLPCPWPVGYNICTDFLASLLATDAFSDWVLDQWVMKLFVSEDSGPEMGKRLMILWTLRILRVLSAARILKMEPELYRLMQGLIGFFSSVIYTALLFVVFVLVYSSIICNIVMEDPHQFKDTNKIDLWFGTVGSTYITLFTSLTCDDWSTPVRRLNAEMPWMEIVWLSYMPLMMLICARKYWE